MLAPRKLLPRAKVASVGLETSWAAGSELASNHLTEQGARRQPLKSGLFLFLSG